MGEKYMTNLLCIRTDLSEYHAFSSPHKLNLMVKEKSIKINQLAILGTNIYLSNDHCYYEIIRLQENILSKNKILFLGLVSPKLQGPELGTILVNLVFLLQKHEENVLYFQVLCL